MVHNRQQFLSQSVGEAVKEHKSFEGALETVNCGQ